MTDHTSNQTDDVVRDPVSGRPLHEFVVDPLRVPTVMPTDGEPIDEPGTQQGPHGKPRKRPIMVFTVDPDADLEEAAKIIARRVIDAQSRID